MTTESIKIDIEEAFRILSDILNIIDSMEKNVDENTRNVWKVAERKVQLGLKICEIYADCEIDVQSSLGFNNCDGFGLMKYKRVEANYENPVELLKKQLNNLSKVMSGEESESIYDSILELCEEWK